MDVKPRQTIKDRKPILRDIWELFIKLLLIALLLLWFVVQVLQREAMNPIAPILILILIAGLIALILRQRHFIDLHCTLTDPSGCVIGNTSILSGRVLEPILGTANGWGFSHYLLELYGPDGNQIPDAMIYPNAAGTPDTGSAQGDRQITAGTLGWLDVQQAVNAAGISMLTSTSFEIRLRVLAVDGTEKTPPCSMTFAVSSNEVYIKRVSTPWAIDYTDPDEPLRSVEEMPAPPPTNPTILLSTVGGRLHVRGAANIFGCIGEHIAEYTLWAIPDSTFSFAQPLPFTTVTPAADWVQMAHVEFKPQNVGGTSYSADDVRAYNVLGGDPDPQILTNTWGTRTETRCFMVDMSLQCLSWKVPDLKASPFETRNLGTGKFTVLLQVKDTSGNSFYDVQRVWVDNENVTWKIEGVGGVKACEDLYTKTSSGAFKTVEIRGTAWDALIDPGDPAKPTSDNFDRYTVAFKKQGAAGEVPLIDSPDPVPPRPNLVGIGKLADWDLSSLDKTSNPTGLAADQLLDTGEACTYDIILQVWDKTIVDENDVHWSSRRTFPIKIVNSPQP